MFRSWKWWDLEDRQMVMEMMIITIEITTMSVLLENKPWLLGETNLTIAAVLIWSCVLFVFYWFLSLLQFLQQQRKPEFFPSQLNTAKSSARSMGFFLSFSSMHFQIIGGISIFFHYLPTKPIDLKKIISRTCENESI